MDINTKDAESWAKLNGMRFECNDRTAILYYKKLAMPNPLSCIANVVDVFLRENPKVTITAMTEIHGRVGRETWWYMLKHLFSLRKTGLLIVFDYH